MEEKDKEKLKEAIELVRKSSESITSTKREAQQLRGALNRIVSAGKDYDYYTGKYDDLFYTYNIYWQTLRTLSDKLHLEIQAITNLENLEESKYYIIVKVEGQPEMKVEIDERQYSAIQKSNFIPDPTQYKRGK